MRIKYVSLLSLIVLNLCLVSEAAKVLDASWSDVVRGNCSDQGSTWWSSDEAIRIAENVLLYQRECGGWPKNTNMQLVLTDAEKESLSETKAKNSDCTIDNGAVYYELTYFSKVYKVISDADMKSKIKDGFQLGIQYLLEAQYNNGGWPQYYPLTGGYSDYITYNDDATVHVLNILKHVYTNDGTYSVVVNDSIKGLAETAYGKGIECILNTQYDQNGKLTAWCAQHDDETLEPAKARSYELASLSGQESSEILSLLMETDNPSKEIKRAVYSGAKWYEEVKIIGQRLESYTNSDGLSDKRIIEDQDASPMWARFYTLEDNRPFFCDRDGIMKFSLAEIGYERRNGYSWYNTSGKDVASNYSTWLRKWGTTILANPFTGQVVKTKDSVFVRAFANKYTGQNFLKFELTIDTILQYTFSYQEIDTVFTLGNGKHSIIVKSVYENDYFETDSVIFTVSLPTHHLSIFGGTGAGDYAIGTNVVVKANSAPTGMIFDRWTGDIEYIENVFDSVTTFTIPESDTQIIATYKINTSNNTLNYTKADGIICYPNPAQNYLFIDLTKIGNSQVEIFDSHGQKIFSGLMGKRINQIKLDFLPAGYGYYLIKITNLDNRAYYSKFIISG